MKIFSIQTGKVRIKQNQLRKARGMAPKMTKVLFDKHWSDWLPIYAWVIDHPEGILVVDTGETYRTGMNGYLPKWHPYYSRAVDFDVKYEDEIGRQLIKMGIHPAKDVKRVVMTHLHTDHAGGLHHFPKSEIIIERREYENARGVSGIMAGYLPHRWPKWMEPRLVILDKIQFGPFERSMPLSRDGNIHLVATPGHSPTHMSVVVNQDGLYYFLAGDASYTQENMMKRIPDGVGSKASLGTLEKIWQFAIRHPTVYLPSHDPESAKRLEGQVAVPTHEKALLNA